MPGIPIHILPESLFTSPRNRYPPAPEYAPAVNAHLCFTNPMDEYNLLLISVQEVNRYSGAQRNNSQARPEDLRPAGAGMLLMVLGSVKGREVPADPQTQVYRQPVSPTPS